MFIRATDGSIFNMQHIISIYYASGTRLMRVDMINGRSARVSDEMTSAEGKACMSIITRRITERKDVIEVPNENEIQAELRKDDAAWHHATGKKTKGHGGS